MERGRESPSDPPLCGWRAGESLNPPYSGPIRPWIALSGISFREFRAKTPHLCTRGLEICDFPAIQANRTALRGAGKSFLILFQWRIPGPAGVQGDGSYQTPLSAGGSSRRRIEGVEGTGGAAVCRLRGIPQFTCGQLAGSRVHAESS